MKKQLGLLATLLAFAVPTAIQAQEGFYAGGFAGVNFLDVRSKHHNHLNTDTGYALGAQLGYKYCDFRLEGEVAYRNNGLDNVRVSGQKFNAHGHVNTWSFMANGYYDLPVDWVVTPYVGAGIGFDTTHGHSRVASAKFRIRENRFAWQAMAGVNYDLTDDVVVNLEYKFHSGQKDVYDHAVVLGAKRYF
jgi:outer membrane autotransporter protein